LTAVRAGRAVRGQRTAPASPAGQLEPDRPGPSLDSTGSQWLILAAEMAGLVNDGWRSPPSAQTACAYLLQTATCALSGHVSSVRAARDFTVATLRRWCTTHSSQDITVVVSELVTNALRHALPEPVATGPPGEVRLGLLEYGPWLLCAVADPSQATPVPRPSGSLAETGRGLQMISALSDLWGYTEPSDAGKIVWAMFTVRRAAPSRSRFRPPAQRPGALYPGPRPPLAQPFQALQHVICLVRLPAA
jgi:anti-sigma regulatory factor (Ser/Thr protein kinase)